MSFELFDVLCVPFHRLRLLTVFFRLVLSQSIQEMVHHRTESGGVSSVLPIHLLSPDQLNEMAKLSAQQARVATKQGTF